MCDYFSVNGKLDYPSRKVSGIVGFHDAIHNGVPPTPFVVRLIDTGAINVRVRGVNVRVPWLVVEYVHGGIEGTTLSQRVMHAIRTTGHAFDAQRAANLVEAIGQGLAAVHEVG